jgi:hypothetical protein
MTTALLMSGYGFLLLSVIEKQSGIEINEKTGAYSSKLKMNHTIKYGQESNFKSQFN